MPICSGICLSFYKLNLNKLKRKGIQKIGILDML